MLRSADGTEVFFNKAPETIASWQRHHIQSGCFSTIDGTMWQLRLKPGDYPDVARMQTTKATVRAPAASKI